MQKKKTISKMTSPDNVNVSCADSFGSVCILLHYCIYFYFKRNSMYNSEYKKKCVSLSFLKSLIVVKLIKIQTKKSQSFMSCLYAKNKNILIQKKMFHSYSL